MSTVLFRLREYDEAFRDLFGRMMRAQAEEAYPLLKEIPTEPRPDIHTSQITLPSGDGRPRLIERYYVALAASVLLLAFFNLTFRLGREFVNEWDESLYGITAWEAVTNQSWIGTTFYGALDYYNTKPPLMVWLIAASFKALGANLISLRLPSVVCAWLTVAIVQQWARRCFGLGVSLMASLVLATTFGFVYVHSGRSAATDAPFTLLMLLAVIVLWAEADRPWRRLWLGPILAATFLLRGMAVLMPIALVIVVVATSTRHRPIRSWPTISALALFLLPIAWWLRARYLVDGSAFVGQLFMYDFVARSIRPIEQHAGGPLYYLNILQKHHFDWLLAGSTALLLFPLPWSRLRTLLAERRETSGLRSLLVAWAAVTLAIPTMMRTKVPWYLNTFYPVFAVALALVLCHGLKTAFAGGTPRWRRMANVAAVVLALGVAEGKLLWYSYHYRDVRLSSQSLMLAERRRLRGQRLFLHPHTRANHFVAQAVVGAEPHAATDSTHLLDQTRQGDYLLTTLPCLTPDFSHVASSRGHVLCRRQVP